MFFDDRKQAGSHLALELTDYRKDKNGLVLGLPRGGVVVAGEVARKLGLPLDVILLRKLPYPPQPELAVGAITEDGTVFVNAEFQAASQEDPSWLEVIIREQSAVIRERAAFYRSHRRGEDLKGKTVILVDDGIATGATMKVAVRSARASGAAKVVVAVPVAAPHPSGSYKLRLMRWSVWMLRRISSPSAKPTGPSTRFPMRRSSQSSTEIHNHKPPRPQSPVCYLLSATLARG